MSKAITAATVPLFDRLAGTPHASSDGRLLDGAGLQHSLQTDLLRLFNIRNGLTISEYLQSEPTVLDYGLPDMLGLSAQNDQDLLVWSDVLRHCLAHFEPRLSHVRLDVRPDPANPFGARATISAVVTMGQQLCRAEFDIALDARSAAPIAA
ncbi:type VI secretion system baseplate subunit TssE [Pseudoduganella ginsengisoli]|uniref:Type VI secretion system baseplate subunit TssE n=1 Tax=Pseudoduganella ginsengisoli TaxID=1462440 RepID=A0A6L6Q3G0_9BURK|nr:type VI secretion system baseplate subunit TssE [Pseudoduganella ginsengisoli]MTW03738.1 type VI secretion system baseplate subunit TssE [Pseudoduganella ginsengisoli]